MLGLFLLLSLITSTSIEFKFKEIERVREKRIEELKKESEKEHKIAIENAKKEEQKQKEEADRIERERKAKAEKLEGKLREYLEFFEGLKNNEMLNKIDEYFNKELVLYYGESINVPNDEWNEGWQRYDCRVSVAPLKIWLVFHNVYIGGTGINTNYVKSIVYTEPDYNPTPWDCVYHCKTIDGSNKDLIYPFVIDDYIDSLYNGGDVTCACLCVNLGIKIDRMQTKVDEWINEFMEADIDTLAEQNISPYDYKNMWIIFGDNTIEIDSCVPSDTVYIIGQYPDSLKPNMDSINEQTDKDMNAIKQKTAGYKGGTNEQSTINSGYAE